MVRQWHDYAQLNSNLHRWHLHEFDSGFPSPYENGLRYYAYKFSRLEISPSWITETVSGGRSGRNCESQYLQINLLDSSYHLWKTPSPFTTRGGLPNLAKHACENRKGPGPAYIAASSRMKNIRESGWPRHTGTKVHTFLKKILEPFLHALSKAGGNSAIKFFHDRTMYNTAQEP